ncbi:MAG TPA: twin-arginine translocase TatA/TatE family subunit [bacterium]|nr:twin-arginine translocase TatA/TatE family subunit [bacterium]
MISMPGHGELLIILFVVLLLFGAKRIPELARGLGKGIREFKDGLKNVNDEIKELDEGEEEEKTSGKKKK